MLKRITVFGTFPFFYAHERRIVFKQGKNFTEQDLG